MTKTKADARKQQIDRLATFIMDEVDGEPSQDEGAVECAIRLLRERGDELELSNSIIGVVRDELREVKLRRVELEKLHKDDTQDIADLKEIIERLEVELRTAYEATK